MWLYVSGWVQVPDDTWWQHDYYLDDEQGAKAPWYDDFHPYDDCASSKSLSCHAAKHGKRRLPLKKKAVGVAVKLVPEFPQQSPRQKLHVVEALSELP